MSQIDPRAAFLATYQNTYDAAEARESFRPPAGMHTCSVLDIRVREANYYLQGDVKLPGIGVSFKVQMAPAPGFDNNPPSWWLRDVTLPADESLVPADQKDRVKTVTGILKGIFKTMLGEAFTGNLTADMKAFEARVKDASNPIWVRVTVKDSVYKDKKTKEDKTTYNEYISAA